MYRYTERINDLTRTYEAETPEQVVALVLAVTMDIQSIINLRAAAGQQLANVDLEKLTRRIMADIDKAGNQIKDTSLY